MTSSTNTDSSASSRTETIAVVGAGICGLFTSLALSRQGFAVTLFEATPRRRLKAMLTRDSSPGSAAVLRSFATLMLFSPNV